MITEANPNDCPACYGSGFEVTMQAIRPGQKLYPVPCKECGGTENQNRGACPCRPVVRRY